MWRVAIEIGQRAGGDPGHPDLFGPTDAPANNQAATTRRDGNGRLEKPRCRFARRFERVLAALRELKVTIVRRSDSPLVESFERAIEPIGAVNNDLCAFENRWSFANLAEQYPGKLSARAMSARGRAMSVDDYRQRLREREEARQRLIAIAPLCDALISLSSPGPAPIHDDSVARRLATPYSTILRRRSARRSLRCR